MSCTGFYNFRVTNLDTRNHYPPSIANPPLNNTSIANSKLLNLTCGKGLLNEYASLAHG
jgi:hypothetical protein